MRLMAVISQNLPTRSFVLYDNSAGEGNEKDAALDESIYSLHH